MVDREKVCDKLPEIVFEMVVVRKYDVERETEKVPSLDGEARVLD